jgi:hypothetical protein
MVFVLPKPGESSYSVLVRAHVQSPSTTPAATLHRITGLPGFKPISGLPNRCGRIVDALSLPLAVDTWIDNHTLFPLFRPFIPQHRTEYIHTSLIESGASKSRIGLLRAHCGADEQLAYCEQCNWLSIARFGFSYWMRPHHVNGVLVCPDHQDALSVVDINQLDWKSRALVMPGNGRKPLLSEAQQLRLHFIAQQIAAILGSKNKSTIQSAHYTDILRSRGLLTRSGRLRCRNIKASVRRWLKPLRRLTPYDGLLSALDVERCWVVSTVMCGRGFSHPLKHVVVLGALESDWDELLSAASRPGFQLEFELQQKSRTWNKSDVVEALNVTSTLTDAAKILGCDVTTMSVLADQAGFSVTRKPKKVTPEIRAVALEKYREGETTAAIAQLLGLSVTTVNRIRRAEGPIANHETAPEPR